jgi:hypothetical protein
MRRADAIWLWDGSTLTDVTEDLGEGTLPVSIPNNGSLYICHEDWLSGLYLRISTPPSAPQIVIETYDGASGEWRRLPLQERISQQPTGHSIDSSAYGFDRPGVAYWGTSRWLWTLRVASPGFPELAPPPSEGVIGYWVRMRNAGTAPLEVTRLLPCLYNTYATHRDVANFLGIPEFTDSTDPLQSFVRHRIRQAEDWLDAYARKTWRVRAAYSERHPFNPYGVRLRNFPIREVTRLGVWAGGQFRELVEGRNADFYASQDLGMVYFTRVIYGRGLPWSSVTSRYLRLPDALEVDYVYGFDFDVDPRRDLVHDVVVKRVAAHIVSTQDWVAVLANNPDAVPKSEKVRVWLEEQEAEAAELRGVLVA